MPGRRWLQREPEGQGGAENALGLRRALELVLAAREHSRRVRFLVDQVGEEAIGRPPRQLVGGCLPARLCHPAATAKVFLLQASPINRLRTSPPVTVTLKLLAQTSAQRLVLRFPMKTVRDYPGLVGDCDDRARCQ